MSSSSHFFFFFFFFFLTFTSFFALALDSDVDLSSSSSSTTATATVSLNQIQGTVVSYFHSGDSEEKKSSTSNQRSSSSPSSAQIRVVITGNSGQFTTYLRADGTFVFDDIPSGAYLLEVLSTEFIYPKLRLDVSSRYNGKVKARDVRTMASTLPHPLIIAPEARAQFFEMREPFRISSILKNPTLLIMGASLLLMVGMPKLMSMIDPEALKELQQEAQQQSQQGGSGSLFSQLAANSAQNLINISNQQQQQQQQQENKKKDKKKERS